jgi:multicomponent Na+:H+ antiporter subunit G
MIEWAVDGLLYILLLAAVGFGGISVIGLLIFPDSRSRAFTGLRAGIISLALVATAGIFYGLFLWVITGEMQYLLFVLAACLLFVLVIVLNRISSDMICRKSVLAPSPVKEREEHS